jgi:curli production assembly/transport component CsgE
MKYLCILALMMLALCGFAQTDSDQSDKSIQDAPESLQKLISDITSDELKKQQNEDADIEIDGLLFDETKTKSGRDFYDYFYSGWEAPAEAKNYSIFIQEKPYRLTTTMIEVKINETIVFQSFLQPRQEIVEMLAEQATQRTRVYLQNYEEIIRQMEGEDRSGSGIF